MCMSWGPGGAFRLVFNIRVNGSMLSARQITKYSKSSVSTMFIYTMKDV